MPRICLKKTTYTFIFLFIIVTRPYAQEPNILFTPVISGLTQPVEIVNAGDGTKRLFVVLQGNLQKSSIIVYDQNYNKLDTFLKVPDIGTEGEQGLLSMAFHPQYGNLASPFFGVFYIYYTNSNGDLQIARYKVSNDPNVADPNSKDTVLTISHPINSNHNGGTIRFGNDGYLYLATGDGGTGGDPDNNAQSPNILLGKMLRINVTSSATSPFYTIPPDNPYTGFTTPDTLDEIYSFGLRNPFRWSFDRQTHDMWIGDVGAGSFEEISFRRADSTARSNFGWRCYEGNMEFNTSLCGPPGNYIFPVFTYPNTGSAVIAGVVYRGTQPINAALVGYFIAADYYSGTIYKIRPNNSGGWTTYAQLHTGSNFANFGETEDGEILAVAQFGDNIFTITVDGILPARLINFNVRSLNYGVVMLRWKTSFEETLSHFEIEVSTDGVNFNRVGLVRASNRAAGDEYVFDHTISYSGRLYYRLKMVNIDNSHEYSAVVSIDAAIADKNFVRPSEITTSVLTMFLNRPFNSFILMNMEGSVVIRKDINRRTGRIDISLPVLSPGIYVARLQSNELTAEQKIIIR